MKIVQHFFLFLFLILNTASNAQEKSLTHELISNYEGKKGFTTITINPSLFKMLSSIKTSDPEYAKIKKFADKLVRIKIIIQNDEKDTFFEKDISNFMNTLQQKGYDELISMTEDGNKISFVSLEKKEKTKEIVMSISGPESMLMVIDGDFTVDDILEISKDVKIGGMDKLNQKKQ